MDWKLFASLSIIGWGMMGVLQKAAIKGIGPWMAGAINLFFEFLIAVIVVASIVGKNMIPIRTDSFGLAALAGICGGGAFMSFCFALRTGPVSLVQSFASLNPIVAVLLAILFVGEKITGIQIVGLILATSGLFLMTK
jgi:transporter family protein